MNLHCCAISSPYPDKGALCWFTGLSGSGKSTLTSEIAKLLRQQGERVVHIDGDAIRAGLCYDLGFSAQDRTENIRRVGFMAQLLVSQGFLVFASLISPAREDREFVRSLFCDGNFHEIYVDCPLSVCEGRDVKGLYRKARDGDLAQFTGISSAYQPPLNPELTIHSSLVSIEYAVEQVKIYLEAHVFARGRLVKESR